VHGNDGKACGGARELGMEPLIDPVMNIVTLDVPDLDEVRKKLRIRAGSLQ